MHRIEARMLWNHVSGEHCLVVERGDQEEIHEEVIFKLKYEG